jgi:hypothetical protein
MASVRNRSSGGGQAGVFGGDLRHVILRDGVAAVSVSAISSVPLESLTEPVSVQSRWYEAGLDSPADGANREALERLAQLVMRLVGRDSERSF